MTSAYIGIGSNQSDRVSLIRTAINYLCEIPDTRVSVVSKFYESAAVTLGEAQPDYINAAIALETDLTASDVLRQLHAIEARMGRPLPRAKWQPRPIDLDLLDFNRMISETPELQLPHPEIAKRLFVLLPLRDIAPAWIHPKTRESIDALVATCCKHGDQRIRPLSC
jgi:2-amino-4-hydroxy-6-hydroxymethyldihydropteridine diphosphokinase